jgi:hypothetical protein
MATFAVPSLSIMELAAAQRPRREVLAAAQDVLSARRQGPPDLATACEQALLAATGVPGATTAEARAARAIAAAVERHGAGFPPGQEPAYHDRHHQAETILAMGWLAGLARRQGLLDTREAALAVAAMAGHDLLHDGSVGGSRGVLEKRSADATAAIAEAEGLDADGIAAIRRIIAATTWPWDDAEAPDLPCRLAREADLFGSALPELGPSLARRLVTELAAAGQEDAGAVASHAARLSLLQALPAPTPPAATLGLAETRADQLAAYVGVAQNLRLTPPSAEAAAAVLDHLDTADAEALLAAAATAS